MGYDPNLPINVCVCVFSDFGEEVRIKGWFQWLVFCMVFFFRFGGRVKNQRISPLIYDVQNSSTFILLIPHVPPTHRPPRRKRENIALLTETEQKEVPIVDFPGCMLQ